MKKVKAKGFIKVHCRGKLTDGEVFDYLVGWDPIEFTIVSVQMIKGFDNAVAGMESNGENMRNTIIRCVWSVRL